MKIKQVLSIQSYVAYGYVGNKSAMFCLSQMGIEPIGVHTVQFSNHTGYENFSGQVMSSAHVASVLEGLEQRGVFPQLDAVLSGYQGSVALGELILETVKKIKALNPSSLYCCDPVIGDVGPGQFVKPSVADFIKHACVEVADILTPNLFELAYLTGYAVEELDSIKTISEVCQELHAKGPKILLVTSLPCETTSEIQMWVSSKEASYHLKTPKFNFEWPPSGAGDATAAMFLGHYLESKNIQTALEKTADSIYAVFEQSAKSKERELQFIQAREALVNPTKHFKAKRV